MATYHLSIKSGKRGKASEHAAYIAREGKHSKSEDLLAKEHGNLPDWANNDPIYFWKTADKNERVNGAAYREFEVALPLELTAEQNLRLVQELIQQKIGSKPFQFAIHVPTAALGEDKQPHAHIMFSDRIPDGIDRSPQQHFKRYNPNDPTRGGCKKDSGGKDPATLKNEVKSNREEWANLQNQFLERHGHASRVDHRSNQDRGVDQAPERHLGSAGIKNMSDEEKGAYKDKRKPK